MTHKLLLSDIHSSLMVGGRYGLECIECNKSGKDNTYKKTWPQRIYCAYPKHHSLLKVKRLKDNPAKDRPQTLLEMLVMDSVSNLNSNFGFFLVWNGKIVFKSRKCTGFPQFFFFFLKKILFE